MKLILSMGDCNGIGPEVMFKAIESFDLKSQFSSDVHISIAGNRNSLHNYGKQINAPVVFTDNGVYISRRFCEILDCSEESSVVFGKLDSHAGKLAADAIEFGIKEVQNGNFDALVTMPISKEAIHSAGWTEFPGHTELLAKRCEIDNPLMILCSKTVRVALATIHIPIKDVPETISIDNIYEHAEIFYNSLKNDYGIHKPKIAVLGLNPHAGENGAMGSEEIDIIAPAIKKLMQNSIHAEGPFPADGFFAHGAYKNYDGILAMYHDQGLIPLKLLAKGGGVNVTAGLPIVRTSPDHGTAFSLAGQGIADGQSAYEAIETAVHIIKNRQNK